MSLTKFILRRFSGQSTDFRSSGIAEIVKSNIISVTGIESVRKGDIISAGPHKAWVYALYRDTALAAILSDSPTTYEGVVEIDRYSDLLFSTSKSSASEVFTNGPGESFKKFLASRPPLSHLTHNVQLFTGYQQIDVCQPMSLGQTLLLYGKNAVGKSQVALETAQRFLKNEGYKVVIASPNPMRFKKEIPGAMFYSSGIGSSDVSQSFLAYLALAHAAYLRDQGYHVLYILDDLLYHTYKEKSLFDTEKIMPTNIGSLAFEHSKHINQKSSLTSMIILEDNENDTHRLILQSLNTHMRSICSQVYEFESVNQIITRSKPVLDFSKMQYMKFSYGLPIFSALKGELYEIFHSLQVMRTTEDIKKRYGITSDPWEKYLLLDSKYFISFLCQSTPMSILELIVYIEFVVFSVKSEQISMFRLEMIEVREELLKFVKRVTCEVKAKILKDPANLDVDWTLREVDDKIIKPFFIEAKMNGWLKEFKDDYDELMAGTSPGGVSSLKESSNNKDQVSTSQKFFERITGLKN